MLVPIPTESPPQELLYQNHEAPLDKNPFSIWRVELSPTQKLLLFASIPVGAIDPLWTNIVVSAHAEAPQIPIALT